MVNKPKNVNGLITPWPLVDALQDLDYGAVYYNGAVAAEHPRCSEIGAEIMKKGGNAVDATIASLLCVGVVHNFASGLGG